MESKIIEKISKYNDDKLQEWFETEDLDILHKIKLYADDLYYNTGKSSGLDDWQYDMLKDTLKVRDPYYVVPVGVKIRKYENRVKLPFWLGSMNKISIQTNPKNIFVKAVTDDIENEIFNDNIFMNQFDKIKDKLQIKNTKIFVDEFNRHINIKWDSIKNKKADIDKWKKLALKEYEIEIAEWLVNNKVDKYIIEDKLDGVSCLMVMNNGKIKLYTRGDGEIGADISYLSQYFDTIPKNLNETICVRGELILEKDVFMSKYFNNYANPRNMVAGLIGAKTVRKGLEDIKFIAYEIVDEDVMSEPSKQLEYLDIIGFKTARRQIFKFSDMTIDNLMGTLVQFKANSPFEIDGIIIQSDSSYIRNTSGNPDYAFAFKMRLEGNLVDSEVVSVEWNISKWGQLKPRIQIIPVQLGGVTISWVTGFNGKFIMDNNIGSGSIIQITRSGDVIPYIVKIVKKASSPDMPDIPYKWNETNVDIYTEEFGDKMCIKLIANFFTKLGIKQIAEKSVEKIYEAGYNTLFKIIAATKKDLSNIPGFGSRKAEITYDNIHNGLKNLSLPVVLGVSGIFGFGLGQKKINTLLIEFPNILDVYNSMSKTELFNRVLGVEGFSDKSAQKIVDNIDWANKFINGMKYFATFKETNIINNKMTGMKIVFTGFRDKKLEEEVTARGGKITMSISKNTSILVTKSKVDKPTGKIKKALELGVEVISKEEFITKYITN